MNQDLSITVADATVKALACHALVVLLIKTDWIRPIRSFMDRAYQRLYRVIWRQETFYSMSSCYLCMSSWASILFADSVLEWLALIGCLEILNKLTKRGASDRDGFLEGDD